MGLMGLLLVYGWRRGGALGESLKASMIRFVVYIADLQPGLCAAMDHFNHLGGFVCGALLAFVVPDGGLPQPGRALFWQVLSVAGVLLVALRLLQRGRVRRLPDLIPVADLTFRTASHTFCRGTTRNDSEDEE